MNGDVSGVRTLIENLVAPHLKAIRDRQELMDARLSIENAELTKLLNETRSEMQRNFNYLVETLSKLEHKEN